MNFDNPFFQKKRKDTMSLMKENFKFANKKGWAIGGCDEDRSLYDNTDTVIKKFVGHISLNEFLKKNE